MAKVVGYINYEKEERECSRCNRVLPFIEFYGDEHGSPKSICIGCTLKAAKERYRRKKEMQGYSVIKERDKLQDENKRLREALHKIAFDAYVNDIPEGVILLDKIMLARKALEEE